MRFPLLAVCVAFTTLSVGACTAAPDAVTPCAAAGDAAGASCVTATLPASAYVDASLAYFDTMDRRVTDAGFPAYADRVVRWEWPPWLLLTGYGREQMESGDLLLRLYPSIVEDRDCQFFDAAPFGRCRVTFVYDAHQGQGCPIYEEFSFDEAGDITFIEAWSDQPGLRPTSDDDPWGERADTPRLSTRVPGLGARDGLLDPEDPAFVQAAEGDADLAELRARMQDFFGTWSQALADAGDDLWSEGCGW
ncbi:MAG: hypothetical protein H6733_03830 [Alphaproteobacteria bacterium]|nr:hypothetical protein [Alphaproteobacteria bacterium]